MWARELDLYGNAIAGDSSFIPFLYQGQYYDEEIGLAYNRFRYYSPESGTYISQDPIGLAGNNPNIYAYVFDSNTEVDVFGLYEEFGIFPYKSNLHKNDGMDAHELLQNAWLETKGISKRGKGLSRKNPAIAIFYEDLHKIINDKQRLANLYDPDFLYRQTVLRNININAIILKESMIEDLIKNRNWDPLIAKEFAHKKTRELRKQAILFAQKHRLH